MKKGGEGKVTAETQVQSKIVRPALLQFCFQAQQQDGIAWCSVLMKCSLIKTLFLPMKYLPY